MDTWLPAVKKTPVLDQKNSDFVVCCLFLSQELLWFLYVENLFLVVYRITDSSTSTNNVMGSSGAYSHSSYLQARAKGCEVLCI